jgi:drug/metabolite transporter (DMT)-like permease
MAVIVSFCTIAAFLLMNRWQRQVTATEAGLVYCAEPVFVSLLALFLPGWLSHWAGVNYPNEQLTVRLLLGGGLITAANVLLQSRWLEAKRVDA